MLKTTFNTTVSTVALLFALNASVYASSSEDEGPPLNPRYSVGQNKEWDRESIHSRAITEKDARVHRRDELSYGPEDEWERATEYSERVAGRGVKEQKLAEIKEIRRYINKGNLEITPEAHTALLKLADFYASSFHAFDRGLIVKGWRASLGFESLLELLQSFSKVKSFKFEIIWDEEKSAIETITRAIQFYEDLADLDLRGCRLNDENIKEVVEALMAAENSKLKNFNVSQNELTEVGLAYIQASLPELASLKSNFSGQSVEDDKRDSKTSLRFHSGIYQIKTETDSPLSPRLSTLKLSQALNENTQDSYSQSKRLSTSSSQQIELQERSIPQDTSSLNLKTTSRSVVPELQKEDVITQSFILSDTEQALPSELLTRARKGDKDAYFTIAEHYQKGRLVAQDPMLAFQWTLKAAESNHRDAQFNVAVMYAKGLGVANDEQQAFFWFKRAADNGDIAALYNLGIRSEEGKGTDKNLTLAYEAYKKAGEKGHVLAQMNAAVFCSKGLASSKDERDAFAWYKRAADQNHPEALYRIGLRYEQGLGVKKDLKQAYMSYERAAAQDHAAAQYAIGTFWLEGVGRKKDAAQAFAWFEKAAKNGLKDAQFNAGVMAAKGEGTIQDIKRAQEWLKKAAGQGHYQAQQKAKILEDLMEKKV